MKRYLNCLISMVVLLCSAQSHGMVITYTSQSDFMAGIATLETMTLDFESQIPPELIASGETRGDVTFHYAIPDYSLVVDDFYNATSGSNYLGLDSIDGAFLGGDGLTLTFGRTLHALGLYVIGEYDAIWAGDITLSAGGGSVFTPGGPGLDILDGEAFFLGIFDSSGFTSASLSSTPFNYIFNIDDITTAAAAPVPEPGTFLLLGIGLCGSLAWRRFRRS